MLLLVILLPPRSWWKCAWKRRTRSLPVRMCLLLFLQLVPMACLLVTHRCLLTIWLLPQLVTVLLLPLQMQVWMLVVAAPLMPQVVWMNWPV